MKKLITGLLLTISFNTFSQQAILAVVSGGDLYSYDLTNCTKQLIGLTAQSFGDIAFTPNGKLWGINNSAIYSIDPITANATLIGNSGMDAVSLVGLNDTTLLVESGMKLYKINTNTAQSTYIDTIGYQAFGDLTWYDDHLYMVTSLGQIIKMVLNSNITDILSVTPIGNSLPTCEGAVTAAFVDNYHSIVGFNGLDLIKICQIDGSFELLCSNINSSRAFGAASIRLVTQDPPPSSCTKSTGLENISSDNLYSIFPIPTANKLNIRVENAQEFNFNIYNTLGQLVKSGNLVKSTTTIYIDELINGIYFIELSADHKIERKCFIVEK